MRTILVTAAVLAAGCSKGGTGDDCQTFVTRSRPIMADMMKTGNRTLTDDDLAKMLASCRKDEKMRKDPVFACVLGAADDAAVRACYQQSFQGYTAKSKATEAKLTLTRLGKNLKVAYDVEAKLPTGKAGPTPAAPCCQGPDQKCPVDGSWAADPIWSALDIAPSEPGRFQYAYESDGTAFTARAIGDLDCDGTAVTYTLTGKVEGDALVVGEVVAPTTPD